MARSFSSKDAKILIKNHKEILSKLQDISNISEKCRIEINNLSLKLADENVFLNNARNELLSGISDKSERICQLLRTIQIYNKTLSISARCRQLYNENNSRILNLIKDLSVGTAGIFWLFSTSKRKTTAEAAFDQLQLELNNEYYKSAVSIIQNVSGIQTVSDQDIWNDFSQNVEFYKTTFLQYAPSAVENGGYIPELSTVLRTIESLQRELSNARSAMGRGKEEIKKAGERFLAQEVVNVLKTVPVEELNHEKNGIRVKALRDSGFSNMADLLGASIYQIHSVYGISEDAAYTIKRIVRQFAENAQKETKIKLSADNKTREATNLVRVIFEYRKMLATVSEIDRFEEKSNRDISPHIKCLEAVKNGAPWLFFSNEQKAKTVQSWQYLKARIEGDYTQEVHRLSSLIGKAGSSSDRDAWADFSENSIVYFNILEEIMPGFLGNDDKLYGLPEELAREIQEECFFPDGLNCELRRYQEWGVKYILHQEKVLLGDEMGLGKTIQAIATMVSLRNTGATHFVVVCPASVLPNWCKEIAEKSKLRVTMVHGAGRKAALQSWIKTGGVAVTTYETTNFFKFENEYQFELLVVDEAHYIKNAGARRSENVRSLSSHANRLLLMTGTALENKVDEMISLIQVCRPEIASRIRNIAFMSTAPQFREKIAPVYYRRKREDVLTELPDLIESKEWCMLSPEEETIYERTVLNKNYMAIRRLSWNVGDLKKSSKATRMLELIEEATEDGRKILVFSFFLETLRDVCAFLGDRCLNPINGSVSPQRRQEIIDEFEKAPAGTVLCAQIQSGGTGLNIQAASVVIICEPQLKPSIESQAISRAYRMGQARNVLVYRLLCTNTTDEKIMGLLEEKQAVFDAFADRSVAAIAAEGKEAEIDEKTFGKIIEEEIDRINTKNGRKSIHNNPAEKSDFQSVNAGDNLGSVVFFNEKRETSNSEKTVAIPLDPSETLKKSKNTDYTLEMGMTYDELVQHLLGKYGRAKEDYFLTEGCYSKNKRITRSREGLICHHIDEDKAIMLCNDEYAKRNPFKYQKADRLVYCNILEHFLLHIKIAEEPRNPNANDNELPGIGGAVNLICRQINDYFNGYDFQREWQVIQMSILEGHFEDYIQMLQHLWEVVKRNPVYLETINKKSLCCGWNGNIVKKVYDRIY